MKKIIKHVLPDQCRIIAVSDIHTCWYLLDSVLKKAEYRPGEDYLVIVGDILEHWDQNLQTIEYIMKLSQNERVYCLMGNNDTASYHMAYRYGYEKFISRSRKKPCSTFLQMAEKIGITEFPVNRFEELRQKVYDTFKTELDFIERLPYVLETQDHIFVHAGIENRPDWWNTSDTYALTEPFYLRQSHCTGKWVVVGHFPCYNYKRGNNTNLPIIDAEKKIICIDGGLTIKHACQLNAFCIHKNGNNYKYETIWDTFFEKKKIIRDHNSGMSPVYCDPYNNILDTIKSEGEISFVRDIISGTEGTILTDRLVNDEKGCHTWEHLNSFLSVKKGETVSLCRISGSFAQIISENGQVGWIPKNIIEN